MSRNQVRAVKVMASEKILLVTKKDEKGRRIGRKQGKRRREGCTSGKADRIRMTDSKRSFTLSPIK